MKRCTERQCQGPLFQGTRVQHYRQYGYGTNPFGSARPHHNQLSGPVTALVLEKDNAIKAWRELMGPTNTFKAKEEAPDRCVEWRGMWLRYQDTHTLLNVQSFQTSHDICVRARVYPKPTLYFLLHGFAVSVPCSEPTARRMPRTVATRRRVLHERLTFSSPSCKQARFQLEPF